MTLIAAFRQPDEAPVLVGDFLITANGARAGSRKKICRVAENFAVGWTGHLIVAEQVLSQLRTAFAGHTRVSVDDVEKLLTSTASGAFGSLNVHLIGWILGPPDVCFCWNSEWPHQLFDESYHYDGTGGAKFIATAGKGGVNVLTSTRGVRNVLFPVTRLMMDEISWRSNQASGFGFAYEILYGADSKFEYLDDITWMFAQARFSAAGKHLKTEPVILFYTYRAFGEFSVVQLTDIGSINRHLITPAFKPDARELQRMQELVDRRDGFAPIGSRLCLAMDLVREGDTRHTRSVPPLIVTRWPGDPTTELDLAFDPNDGPHGGFRIVLPSVERLESIFGRLMAG